MEPIAFIIVGWITGLLGRALLPSPNRMGLIRMLLIGMVGGIFGGLLGGTFYVERELFSIGAPSLIGAFLGASVAVLGVTILSRQRVHV